MAYQRSFIIVMVSATLLLAGAVQAFAHAELKQATPSIGSTVSTAPGEVALNFSEELEPSFSTVVVRDSGGRRVDKDEVQVDNANRSVMRVSLESLTPGIYIVEWRVVTADTHHTEGTFKFRVGE
jgi:methionine-rich copper-binding protein CopC